MSTAFAQQLVHDIRRYEEQLRDVRSERQASKLRMLLEATRQRLTWKNARQSILE